MEPLYLQNHISYTVGIRLTLQAMWDWLWSGQGSGSSYLCANLRIAFFRLQVRFFGVGFGWKVGLDLVQQVPLNRVTLC